MLGLNSPRHPTAPEDNLSMSLSLLKTVCALRLFTLVVYAVDLGILLTLHLTPTETMVRGGTVKLWKTCLTIVFVKFTVEIYGKSIYISCLQVA